MRMQSPRSSASSYLCVRFASRDARTLARRGASGRPSSGCAELPRSGSSSESSSASWRRRRCKPHGACCVNFTCTRPCPVHAPLRPNKSSQIKSKVCACARDLAVGRLQQAAELVRTSSTTQPLGDRVLAIGSGARSPSQSRADESRAEKVTKCRAGPSHGQLCQLRVDGPRQPVYPAATEICHRVLGRPCNAPARHGNPCTPYSPRPATTPTTACTPTTGPPGTKAAANGHLSAACRGTWETAPTRTQHPASGHGAAAILWSQTTPARQTTQFDNAAPRSNCVMGAVRLL